MESQNHYYGYSAALAAYVGIPRPRHIAGLVQHGWTAASPVATHFRDFPRLGRRRERPRLLVWSHTSRAWDPAAGEAHTTPIGAQLAHLARAMRDAGLTLPQPVRPADEVVLMPVHGIQTQRVRGDHHGIARLWREREGAATACLYQADADDPEILDAYRSAGHRVVILGDRLDVAFVWRLVTMLGRARRVVSNRLSTPIMYAAHLGASIGVYGDAMTLDGEGAGANDRVRELWPELHAPDVPQSVARSIADAELGVAHLRPAPELTRLLGWDHPPVVPAVQHWTISPVQRAVVNLRRKAATPAPAEGAPPLSFGAWLQAAMTYLPDRLPTRVPAVGEAVEPIPVA